MKTEDIDSDTSDSDFEMDSDSNECTAVTESSCSSVCDLTTTEDKGDDPNRTPRKGERCKRIKRKQKMQSARARTKTTNTKQRTKNYKQKFRKSWLENGTAKCAFCTCTLKPKLFCIKQHLITNKHKENAKPFSDLRSSKIIMEEYGEINTKEIEDKRTTESRLALFTADHTSIQTIDHLTEVVKEMCPMRNFIQMKRTKCTAVIKSVLGPHFNSELVKDVGDSPYSLLLDESTDISTLKLLGVAIRYVSLQLRKSVSTYLSLVAFEDGTADFIVAAVDKLISSVRLNKMNCIGIATDNAAVIVGVTNGVHKKLQSLWGTKLVLIRCVYHSIQLGVSSAVEELPKNLDFLIRETYNWFCHSTSRQNNYHKMYMDFYGEAPLKILQLSNTRWLSRYQAIEQIVSQWEILKTFFESVRSKEKCYTTEHLVQMYNDNINYCYLLYLKKILYDVNRVEVLYQSNNDPFKLIDDLVELVDMLANNIINPNVRPKFNVFSTPDLSFYVEPNVYFGFSCEEKLKRLPKEESAAIKSRCIKFVLHLINELKQRLPDNYKQLQTMDALRIDKTLRHVKPTITSLITLLEIKGNFSNDIIDRIETQWNNIILIPWNKDLIKTNDLFRFWLEVKEYKDAAGQNPFNELATVALRILSLPLSNAEVERIFSCMNIVKNKKTTRMKLPLVNAILNIRFGLKRIEKCCYNYDIPIEVKKMIGTTAIYQESQDAELVSKDELDDDFYDGLPLIVENI